MPPRALAQVGLVAVPGQWVLSSATAILQQSQEGFGD